MTPDRFGCVGSTIKVAAGHYVDLANPTPAMIDIQSIASALSKICRFGGHCPHYYSVAEHCVHATMMAQHDGVSDDALKCVLLHDAAEAYVGDVVKPLKVMLPDYTIIEQRIEAAIETAFGINFEAHGATVKLYDRSMLKAEKMRMWPDDAQEWAGFHELPERAVPFQFWGPPHAYTNFMNLASELKS